MDIAVETRPPEVRPPAGPRRRRRWVRWLVLVVGALLALPLLGLAFVATQWFGSLTNTAGEASFARPMAIPPLADSTVDARGRRVFDLRMQAGSTDFGQGRPTETWGFNGSYLGPTLRAERGERVQVNVTNDIGQTSTVHWHGMHLPARMDGGPHQVIEPGATWSPNWRVDQPAATLWYHPHPHGATAQHVYRGLAGMFLLDDPEADALDLPDRYGIDDLPVIVQDKAFTRDGQLDDAGSLFANTGVLGDTILVNGTVTPHQDVRTERVRLRLLNASNARIYNFGFADDQQFELIGTDGGLLPAPVTMDRLRLSPGERAEVVVTMRPGQDSVLRSYPPDLGADAFQERFSGGDDTFDVLQLRAADLLEPSPPLPVRLASAPALDDADATTTRTFRLGASDINDRDMDPARIDEVVTVGDTEVWEVRNAAGTPHNFHVHDVQFQVLHLDGEPPPPELSGWKDTVYVTPGSTVRLIMRFTDYADPNVPYMFHCHLLEHEDAGMMGQFVVVRPGQQPGRLAGAGPGRHDDHAADGGA